MCEGIALSKKHSQFNYCVGKYWNGIDGPVSVYAYGNEVFFGTMKEANAFRKYVKDQNPDRDYRIFQLVEVPE